MPINQIRNSNFLLFGWASAASAWSMLRSATAAALALACLHTVIGCVDFQLGGTCGRIGSLTVPDVLAGMPNFNASVEDHARAILAGITGGDQMRKPCGFFPSKCCLKLTRLACQTAVIDIGREMSTAVAEADVFSCMNLTVDDAFTQCNNSTWPLTIHCSPS